MLGHVCFKCVYAAAFFTSLLLPLPLAFLPSSLDATAS